MIECTKHTESIPTLT